MPHLSLSQMYTFAGRDYNKMEQFIPEKLKAFFNAMKTEGRNVLAPCADWLMENDEPELGSAMLWLIAHPDVSFGTDDESYTIQYKFENLPNTVERALSFTRAKTIFGLFINLQMGLDTIRKDVLPWGTEENVRKFCEKCKSSPVEVE